MKIRKHIPNIVSLCNITCGVLAIYFAFTHSLQLALWLVVLAAVFDFFDGLAARALGAFSPLGKDIDSLCDVVSFGVAPAVMMVHALDMIGSPVALVAVLIAPASAYRLAKFNNDTRQSTSFIGLPTPANALFFIGLAVWISLNVELIVALPRMIHYKVQALLVVLVLLFSWLLISEVPMFSLKQKDGGRRYRVGLLLTLVVGVVGVLLWGYLGLSCAILFYVLFNLMPTLKRSSL